MTYVRPSSLGVAEFCPRAVELNEQSGISRAAIISTAWHAKLAGNDTLIGELHPEERKEVATYGVPTDVWPPQAIEPVGQWDSAQRVLDYESAEKELHVKVWERDDLITEGTLDFAWVRDVGGQRWAFVADLKRNTWAIPDGPDCLQLAAYGHGYASLRGCVGYTPGLWSGTDSEWTWGTPIDLTSPEALDLWLRLKRAAKNDYRLKTKEDDRRFVTGAHCNACYGRQRCPEWFWEVYQDPPEEELNESSAAHLLLRAKAMTEQAERITEAVKVYAERGGVVKDPVTGKRFLPVTCKGRLGLDKEAVEKAGIDLSKFQKRGRPYLQYDWRKP